MHIGMCLTIIPFLGVISQAKTHMGGVVRAVGGGKEGLDVGAPASSTRVYCSLCHMGIVELVICITNLLSVVLVLASCLHEQKTSFTSVA